MPEAALRTQIDGLDEVYSVETGLDCSTGQPDMARQEFKLDSDVNHILDRYGLDGLKRQPEYSAVDYDTDLQQSLDAIREAQRAITKLPLELQNKYNTWEILLAGAASGEFKEDLATYEAEKSAKEKAALDAAAAAKVSSQEPKP